MPIPETKYNLTSKIQIELSNNSLDCSNSYLISCVENNPLLSNYPNPNPNSHLNPKIYLNSKADYLIHPFSQASNYQNKFNNQNTAFRYIPPKQCHSCQDVSSSIYPDQTQRIIQKQARVPSSLYTMNLAALYTNNDNLNASNNSNNNASDRKQPHGKKKQESTNTSIRPNYGIDIKHNSYDRYLNKKKSQYLKTQQKDESLKPLYGNKTFKLGLIKSTTNQYCSC